MSDIDAGKRVLARFAPVNVGLAFVGYIVFFGFFAWIPGRELLAHPDSFLDVIVLFYAAAFALAIAGPAVGLWRLYAHAGEAVWVQGDRLYWSPWGSTSIDGLTRVRPARFSRGASWQIVLDRDSPLSATISTGLLDIDRDTLMRKIQALRPGLGPPPRTPGEFA